MSSSFPGGLLKTYFVMLPERRHQVYKFVEGGSNHAVVVPKLSAEIDASEDVVPLKIFLNVWRMFLRDIEAIDSAIHPKDGVTPVDPFLGDRVTRLMDLYKCLPDALNEFSNTLSKLDFRKVSLSPSTKQRRKLSLSSLWALLLQVLGIRPASG